MGSAYGAYAEEPPEHLVGDAGQDEQAYGAAQTPAALEHLVEKYDYVGGHDELHNHDCPLERGGATPSYGGAGELPVPAAHDVHCGLEDTEQYSQCGLGAGEYLPVLRIREVQVYELGSCENLEYQARGDYGSYAQLGKCAHVGGEEYLHYTYLGLFLGRDAVEGYVGHDEIDHEDYARPHEPLVEGGPPLRLLHCRETLRDGRQGGEYAQKTHPLSLLRLE